MEQTQSPKILVYEMSKRLRLAPKDFAARLGVTFISINHWENAKSQPSKMVMKLLKGLLLEMGDRGGVKTLARMAVISALRVRPFLWARCCRRWVSWSSS
jgi:putative transcriptional regulator